MEKPPLAPLIKEGSCGGIDASFLETAQAKRQERTGTVAGSATGGRRERGQLRPRAGGWANPSRERRMAAAEWRK